MKRSFLWGFLGYFWSALGFYTLETLNDSPIIAQTNHINQLLQQTNVERQEADLSPLKLSSPDLSKHSYLSGGFSPSDLDNCQGEDLLIAVNCTDDGLNLEERTLISKINQYRQDAQLSSIPISLALTRLANRHVRDLQTNLRQYDRQGKDWRFGWSNCPFNRNKPQSFNCMWQAPQRLNTGYQGKGYEVICGGNRPITAEIAFNCWQNAISNRDFLLNQGQWQNYRWNAMGVGIYRNYAVIWLGEFLETQGYPPNESQPTPSPENPNRIW